LDSLVSNYLSIAHVRAPGMGCPVAALANDVAREAPDSPVRSRFTRGVRGMVDLMAALVPKTPKQKRRQRALSSLATLVGAVVLARAVDDEALAEEILGAARVSLGAEAPERDTPAGPSNSG
jgi:TetR/AcrR family transcriptional repressor of nem operon